AGLYLGKRCGLTAAGSGMLLVPYCGISGVVSGWAVLSSGLFSGVRQRKLLHVTPFLPLNIPVADLTAARLHGCPLTSHASKGPQTRACFGGLNGRTLAPPPGYDLPPSNHGLVLALEGGHDPNDVSTTIA